MQSTQTKYFLLSKILLFIWSIRIESSRSEMRECLICHEREFFFIIFSKVVNSFLLCQRVVALSAVCLSEWACVTPFVTITWKYFAITFRMWNGLHSSYLLSTNRKERIISIRKCLLSMEWRSKLLRVTEETMIDYYYHVFAFISYSHLTFTTDETVLWRSCLVAKAKYASICSIVRFWRMQPNLRRKKKN